MPTVTDIYFKPDDNDDLPLPIAQDDDVDGMVLLNGRIYIPFGATIPSNGRTDESFGVWSWDGDKANPTLEPSIDLEDFHGHIRNGEFVPVDSN